MSGDHVLEELGGCRVSSSPIVVRGLDDGAIGSSRVIQDLRFPGFDQRPVERCLAEEVDCRSVEAGDAGFRIRFVVVDSGECGRPFNAGQVVETQLPGIQQVVE